MRLYLPVFHLKIPPLFQMKISMCNEMSSDYRSSSNERSNSASPSAAAAVTSRNVGEDFPGEEGGPSSRNLAPSITVAPATPGIPAGSNLEDQLGALDEKLKRTSKFLHEIKGWVMLFGITHGYKMQNSVLPSIHQLINVEENLNSIFDTNKIQHTIVVFRFLVKYIV